MASAACLAGRVVPEPFATEIDFIFKPMLMPFLALFLYVEVKKKLDGNLKHLLIALLFAYGGDLALMMGEGIYFLLGLGSFLVMQILYILLFMKDWNKPFFLQKKPVWIMIFSLIGIVFYYFSYPALKSDAVMVIAVAIYAAALVSMALSALNRKGGVGEQSFQWLLAGALLFMISDLMIGVNQFIYQDFPYAGFAIMSTYITGQWLIIKGYLQNQLR
jgi:uncharacterized membrane protein YhhN